MTDPTVSVIIPAWNAQRWLERCHHSLAWQTFQNFEAIVVDDGSTEAPEPLLGILRKDPRVRAIFHRHKGLSAARNRGIGSARGDYLGFLDADDLLYPTMLEHTVTALRADSSADFCHFDVTRATLSEGELPTLKPLPKPKPIAIEGSLCKAFCTHPNLKIGVCNMLYRRTKLTIRFWEEIYLAEDIDFLFRFLARAQRGLLLSVPLYVYTRTPNSIVTRPFTANHLNEGEKLLRHLVDAFQNAPRTLTTLRRTLFVKQIKVARKAVRKATDAKQLTRVNLTRETRLFADGVLRLRDFPFEWKFRLLKPWLRAHLLSRKTSRP